MSSLYKTEPPLDMSHEALAARAAARRAYMLAPVTNDDASTEIEASMDDGVTGGISLELIRK